VKHPIDRFAHLDSPIHRWDVRWKLISGLCFLFGFGLVRTHLHLTLIGLAMVIGVFATSRLPVRFMVSRFRKLAGLLAFFVVVLMLTGGGPYRTVASIPVSEPGLHLAARLIVKVSAIVLLVATLFATAPIHRTMAALQRLRLPSVLVQLIYFSYRYVFVFADESARMRQALAARGWSGRFDRHAFSTVGQFVGNLLVHSVDRAERVQQALSARGYDGTFRTTSAPQTRATDVLKSLALAGAGGALAVMEVVSGSG
jgi:cobalt/nickel transport system permease protein